MFAGERKETAMIIVLTIVLAGIILGAGVIGVSSLYTLAR